MQLFFLLPFANPNGGVVGMLRQTGARCPILPPLVALPEPDFIGQHGNDALGVCMPNRPCKWRVAFLVIDPVLFPFTED